MAIIPINDPSTTSRSDTPLNFRSFESKILYFNGMYKLPCPPKPTLMAVAKAERLSMLAQTTDNAEIDDINEASPAAFISRRLTAFKHTLLKEIEEVDLILEGMSTGYGDQVDILTELADWLGDIQVYCASEMAKFGLPNKEILEIIMRSNFSKLQSDGSTKYDADGKVEKGPFYWKPEPEIKKLIVELTSAGRE